MLAKDIHRRKQKVMEDHSPKCFGEQKSNKTVIFHIVKKDGLGKKCTWKLQQKKFNDLFIPLSYSCAYKTAIAQVHNTRLNCSSDVWISN